MNLLNNRMPQHVFLGDGGQVSLGRGINRRTLFKYGSRTALVATFGMTGLLELLANREALAAGTVIPLVGITREPDEADETPHRHTFSARFGVTSISPSGIIGEKEDQHFHIIEATDIELETVILSGTENNEQGEHSHLISIE
jgi:hypothetical protein